MENDFEEKLKAIIKDKKLDCQHYSFTESCHSVAEAAAVVKATARDFIKSICLVDDKGSLTVAVVKGEDKVDIRKVERLVGKKLKLANPAEILDKTGFPVGGTPPFGFKAVFLIDERVFGQKEVYGGGGSDKALVRLAPAEIQKANAGEVGHLVKESA